MNYEETLEIIFNKVNLLQQDIIEHPFRYIKDNMIDEKLICSNLSQNINKCLVSPWIEKSELENIIKGNNIKLDVIKHKKEITYILTNKKGKQIKILNNFKIVYMLSNNIININVILPINGDFLEFNYLFKDIKLQIPVKIDVTNLLTYLVLAYDIKINNKEYYSFI